MSDLVLSEFFTDKAYIRKLVILKALVVVMHIHYFGVANEVTFATV